MSVRLVQTRPENLISDPEDLTAVFSPFVSQHFSSCTGRDYFQHGEDPETAQVSESGETSPSVAVCSKFCCLLYFRCTPPPAHPP